MQKRIKTKKNIVVIEEDSNNIINNKTNKLIDNDIINNQINNNPNHKINNEENDEMNKIQELWIKIKNFSNYEISNEGRVKNMETNRILNGWLKNSKHTVLLIDDDGKKRDKIIAYLVAENFIDNPYNYNKIEHIDGNKTNNYFTNLRWIKQLKRSDMEEYKDAENEKWKTLTDYSDYEVSDKGNIRNIHTKQLMKTRDSNGYRVVSIKGNNCLLVHRLVAIEFLPNIYNKPSVDHIDRNRANNRVENLQWATVKEQCKNREQYKYTTVIPDVKIWRININDENDKQLFDGIENVIDYVIENKLTTTNNRKYIMTNLRLYLLNFEARKKKIINLCYGYKWQYDNYELFVNENLDNEIWKNVKDIYPDANEILISNYGRVKNSLGRLIQGTNGAGYTVIFLGIGNKRYKVHRLVAELFLPNPEKKRCVNHKDGNKINNSVNNLEWVTHSENAQHAMDTNLNKCSKQVKMVNIDTKIETVYKNKKDACDKLKICNKTINKNIKDKIPYKNMMFSILTN